MDKFFGGKDPFDHPFFTQPFGGFFGWKSPFDDPFFTGKFDDRSGSRKQITIEELNPDDGDGYDSWPKSTPSKEVTVRDSNGDPFGMQSFCFQRFAYGGADGVYYTSSVGKRTGDDGVFLMEMKEDDRTVGESLHTISKGIHDKGHSVTTKQRSDGRVDSLQTLHNLQEDELAGFEKNWKTNADKVFPGWSSGFSLLENTEAGAWDNFASWNGWGGWPFPLLEYYGNGGAQPDSAPCEPSTTTQGTSRKIVPIE